MRKFMSEIRKTRQGKTSGFSITEVIAATAMTGILGSIALPSYIKAMHGSRPKEAITTIASLHATFGAFMDATGEKPASWDDLSSIATIMTDNGQAKGDFSQEILLPGSLYRLKIESGGDNLYTFNATRTDNIANYDVKSCFNISNGASDIRSGNGEVNATDPNCG